MEFEKQPLFNVPKGQGVGWDIALKVSTKKQSRLLLSNADHDCKKLIKLYRVFHNGNESERIAHTNKRRESITCGDWFKSSPLDQLLK